MSILLDTNLMVFAFRPELPEHERTRRWMGEALAGSEELALTSLAATGFLRIVTNRRIFGDPAGTRESLGFLRELRRSPTVRSIEPAKRHRHLFEGLCTSLDLQGDDIPDAHLAALAIEHDAGLATHDRGFDRFPGLRTFDPLA